MGTPWRDVPGYDSDVLTVTAAVVRNLASHSLIAVPAAGYVETAPGVFEWAASARRPTTWSRTPCAPCRPRSAVAMGNTAAAGGAWSTVRVLGGGEGAGGLNR